MSIGIIITSCALIFFLVFVFSFGIQRFAKKVGAVDAPTEERKIHKIPTPLFGGLAIGIVIILASIVGWASGFMDTRLFMGFVFGVCLILVVGALDDLYNLPPFVRFTAYAVAVIALLLGGIRIERVTNMMGTGALPIPSVWLANIITFVWLYTVLFATKLMDGMDGLVTGQTMIASAIIAGLCFFTPFYQPIVGVMALVVLFAFAGFLPWNLHPAKQFLGESGSVLAGYCIALLATISSAKIATAFMAVGVPVADAGIVILGRLLRGASPFKGDSTHLHFKLLRYGLTPTQIVSVYWGVAITAGVLALGLQSRGKILLAIALVGITATVSYLTGKMKSHE